MLKEREGLLGRGGTTTESAELSYRIRVMIRGLKDSAAQMAVCHEKEVKKVRVYRASGTSPELWA